jgi:hypothetical protein
MADQPQTIVEPAASDDKPYGSRNGINLRASFSASPIYAGDVNDDERKEVFQELALDGTVVGGLGLNSFNRDFSNAPDLSDVETGGGGKPASPYVPNLSSPGPGSVFPADQPEYTGELPDGSAPEFGSGLGGTVSPSKTSENIADQKLGDYISGRSYQGSDGRG